MTGRFSDTLMEHFLEPRNRGQLPNPDGVGVAGTPGEGPFFVVQLQVLAGRVTDVRFDSHNCGVTVACGSVLTLLVKDCLIAEALLIRPEHLATQLEGVPVDKQHVPVLAISTLQMALKDFDP